MAEAKNLQALIAVQDEDARLVLSTHLRRLGWRVQNAPRTLTELSDLVRATRCALLFFQVDNSLALLASLRHEFPALPIIIVAPPSPEVAFEAARLGARHLLTLPLNEQQLHLEKLAAACEGDSKNGRTVEGEVAIFSSSGPMQEIRDTISKVATTSATVLIRGESGVGKELVARMIFSQSGRRGRPFIKVNCAAIPNELLESELFGYEAGAFTGAQQSKPGKFELADGGTLFLDEIGEMHPALQAKLLHVLQDGVFARLGARRDTTVDVRLICATNKPLEQRVVEGTFREDLFYRINVVTVHVPPLRERRDEIRELVEHFLAKYSAVYQRDAPPFNEEVLGFLMDYSWPGNIRELENLVKRYVIVGGATQIVRELTQHVLKQEGRRSGTVAASNGGPSKDGPSLLEIGRRAALEAEQKAIRRMLEETRWNRREAARRLRVSYKALLNKLQQMDRNEKFNSDSTM